MPVCLGEFAVSEPELSAAGEAHFARTGLALVGTLRRDGWPRISPVEPFIAGGQLFLSMMWRSVKALDLLGDPRCVVHNTVADKDGTEGEFKVYGRAREVSDLGRRRRFGDAVYTAIGFRPEEPAFHCFVIQIESVVFSRLEGGVSPAGLESARDVEVQGITATSEPVNTSRVGVRQYTTLSPPP